MYIIDLESRPDPKLLKIFEENIKPDARLKDPAKIAESIREKIEDGRKDMAVDPDWATIVCVGVKEFGKEPMVMSPEEYCEWLKQPREELDQKRWKNIEESSTNASQKMVTFNGRNFDIPLLIKYGIKHGLDFPYSTFINALDKYKGNNHVDLMEKLSMVFGKSKSLDTYMRIYLGIQKETLGDEFFRNATDEELKKHCLQDLVYTEELYKKFEPLFV